MKYVLLAGAFLMLMASCSKTAKPENTSEVTQKNKRTLTEHQWVITSQKIDYQRTTQKSPYAIPPIRPCQQDDIYTFLMNGSFTVDEGKQSCMSPPPDSIPLLVCKGSWACLHDTLTIQLSEGNVLTYHIQLLTQDEMILEKKLTLPNGQYGYMKQLFHRVEKK